MATNLELKVKVNDFRKIIKTLNSAGAEFKGVLVQKDIYFKNGKGLLKLRRQNGKYELIYYNRDETGKKRWSDFEVIFLQGEKIEKTFSRIFETETTVEKRRRLYIYKGTRVHLDSVKGLGKFLELETPVTKGKKYAEKIFSEIIDLLKLDVENQIKTSYRFLVEKRNG